MQTWVKNDYNSARHNRTFVRQIGAKMAKFDRKKDEKTGRFSTDKAPANCAIGARFTAEEAAEIIAAADKEELTVSKFVRIAVMAYVKKSPG
jgi:hypothetical protein